MFIGLSARTGPPRTAGGQAGPQARRTYNAGTRDKALVSHCVFQKVRALLGAPPVLALTLRWNSVRGGSAHTSSQRSHVCTHHSAQRVAGALEEEE